MVSTFADCLSISNQHDYIMTIRIGQQAFNDLYESEPEIADQIRGTDADPFYLDENLGKFYTRVAQIKRQRKDFI